MRVDRREQIGRTRRRGRSQSGFVLIVAALAIVMLFGFLGLAVDVGYLQFQKRRIQTAADAAAQGGALEVRAHSSSTVVTAARNDAALNGFAHGTNGVTVTVNFPPATGVYAGKTNAVEAIVTQTNPTYFLGLLGFNSTPVAARAVARVTSNPNCVYVMDPTSSAALSASGNGTAEILCGIMVNSSSGSAAVATGNGCVTAKSITVVGGYGGNSNGCGLQPAPTTGATPESDPLAYLAPPTVGACDQTNFSISAGIRTINPGVYCGGISVSGMSTVLYLNPGIYIMQGGGLNVSGQANVIGTGITIYNTGDATYRYAAISMSGGAITTLSAPTTGPYAGILFFQDRSITSTAVNHITGGVLTVYNGAMYFPTTPLAYSGNSVQNGGYTLIVAYRLTFSGSTALTADYSTLPGGSPITGGIVFGE